MTFASGAGSNVPALSRIHASARCVDSGLSFPSAAQQRHVVLMLLKLIGVSPQPPSAFWFATNQSIPPRIIGANSGFELSLNVKTAVAVDNALGESSPTQ